MNKKILLFIILVLAIHPCIKAEHLKGGWIKYEYVGPGIAANTSIYNVTVYQYLDCHSTGGQIDATVIMGVFDGTGRTIQKINIPQSGTIFEEKRTFQCINNPPDICYRIDYYTTSIEVPSGNLGYTLAVQRCCRVHDIVNLEHSSETGVTYSVKIPGNGNTGQDYINKSAVFAQEDTAIVCRNNSFTLAFSATDPDGDSLRYRFVQGYGTPTTVPVPDPPSPPPYPAVNYNAPYTASEPMGPGVTINPATGLIQGIAPGTIGDYVIAVAVDEYRNGQKIAETRKEIHIRVEACDIPRAILDPKPTTCDGFTVRFENASSSPSILKYNWDFGVLNRTDDTSNLPTPSYKYQDTGAYTVKLVVNRGNPCVDSTTQVFRVYPGFFPGFDFGVSCKGMPLQFNDTTKAKYGMVDSWRWNFGDETTLADTSHIQNPQYTYSIAGIKNVELIVSSSKGCIDTAHVPVEVLDQPVLTLPFNDTLICSIDTLQLHANGIGNFNWTPNYRISNTNIPNPFVNPLDTTTYTVTLNDRGCISQDSIKVNVLNFITVESGADTTICLTDTVILRPISQALSYQWTPTATLVNPNTKNPLAIPTSTFTTYFVTANLGKCQAKDDITIKAVSYPQAHAGNDTSICFAGTATLSGTVVGATHIWSPASLVSNPMALTTSAFPRATTLFILSVTDTLGCSKSVNDSVLVQVVPPVKVFAGNDTSVVIGQPLVFQSFASSFATLYRWSPVIGINNPAILRPTAVITPALFPVGSDKITYTLTATSPEGCTASDDIVLRIFKVPPTIFIPGAFTPNGDGNNDIIKPILAGMQRLDYFRVYNRYGQTVFQTSEIGKGWDGFINGELQATAAFAYSVQAVDYNGTTVKASGTFVLIR